MTTENAVVAPSGTEAGADGQQPLVSLTMNNILAFMRSENLKVGQPLPSEMALARMFGVSRTVIREALRSLVALSLIDIGNGRRPRVRVPDGDVLGRIVDHAVLTEHVSIQQIFDVRRTIEMRTVELAAMRRTEAEAQRILDLVAQMYADYARPDQVMEHDIAFHIAIGSASRNPMFELIVRSFEAATRQTWRVSWTSRRTEAERMGTIDGHKIIADAIAAGDPHAATKGMADHFDNSVKALLNAGIN
jgi:DNA-binding FadR family transcriptional regulator